VQYSDLLDARPMYDMKRRWFSEVLKIDRPYIQILSTKGNQQATYTGTLSSAQLAPLLQGQAVDGGVVRVVFRSKTNKNFSDETGTAGSYNSGTAGAVMIDAVSITGCAVPVSSGFETAAEINNTIEGPDTDAPGPDVDEGYALDYWHSTGKPPKHYVHTHPLYGGDIAGDGSNVYAPLAWADICGPPDSPLRFCNVAVSVVSTGDHDNNEAAGGGAGTPFLENVNGMMSPAINLVTPVTGVNNMGIDRVHAMTNASWWIRLDNYWGIFDINTDGNTLGFWLYNYPGVQDNGAVVWSDAIPPEFVSYNPDRQCYWFDEDLTPLIRTSSPTGKPDSIRLAINREQRCITWKVTDGCSPTGGHYIDNVTFVLPPPTEGAADKIAVGIWDWYNDAFPANETAGLPGIPAAFDTCAAHIFTGYNIAPATGDEDRYIVPGDSLYFTATNATGEPMRLDIVFRILPGPGNYVTLGNKASGLRRVPTSPTAAVAGDLSFWGQYMADPGPFAKGNHVGGWNVHTWNSVRVDTVERNFFPVDGKGGNLSFLSASQYQTTMHEEEPKLATLGILKGRCFMIDTLGVLEHTNITCTTVPMWLTTLPQNYTGYDGQQQTREFTKIWPDGLFTAGTHVEYFIRLAKIGSEAVFVMNPDTNMITPQMYEGPSWDGHRWQEFSILPDRWKDALYGGIGGACMLVVDNNDRRGDEIVFVSLADSIGLTKAAKYGAHNGWHCTAAYSAPSDGSDNFYGEGGCGDDPTIAVWAHGGSPGTLWDMYQIKASESSTTGSAYLGDRLANRSSMGLLTGKEGRHGPTPEMLRTYYKMIFWFSGDLNMSIMGPEINMGQDDVALLQDFLGYNASVESPRGFYGVGDGFVEALDLGGADPRTELVNDYFATNLRDISYYNLQGMVPVTWNELIPTSVITTGGEVYGLMNGCLYTNDVLEPNRGVSGAVASSYYEPIGANAPYISGVYAPPTTQHPYMTMVDGWDMWNMYNLGVSSTMGRLEYYMKVLGNTFYSVCPFVPELTVDVPSNTARNVNFLDDVAGNPLVRGMATVRFSLAKADRVEIKVYDVTGRLVKSLADKTFGEGPQTVTWDGTNDQGRTVSRGVYFTQVKYVNSGFVDAKKVTVLK